MAKHGEMVNICHESWLLQAPSELAGVFVATVLFWGKSDLGPQSDLVPDISGISGVRVEEGGGGFLD